MELVEYVTDENLDAEAYLAANPDVDDAVPGKSRRHRRDFARAHFDAHGRFEARRQYRREALADIQTRREVKLQRLLERSPAMKRTTSRKKFRFLGERMVLLHAKSAPELPWPMNQVSANAYDPSLNVWLEDRRSSLLLDLGAGLRTRYADNIVNVEVDCLPTTDVLALGDRLPFDDGTFDGAVCLAVLEHVKDPFAVASELMRVVRPGAEVVVDWPFLQPVHGYPHHYFNATPDGAIKAFERLSTVRAVSASTPDHFHPVFAVNWILSEWMNGLPEPRRSAFAQLTVDDIISTSPHELIRESPWVTDLPEAQQRGISAGTRLRITRA